jgi:hypothetical protein
MDRANATASISPTTKAKLQGVDEQTRMRGYSFERTGFWRHFVTGLAVAVVEHLLQQRFPALDAVWRVGETHRARTLKC